MSLVDNGSFDSDPSADTIRTAFGKINASYESGNLLRVGPDQTFATLQLAFNAITTSSASNPFLIEMTTDQYPTTGTVVSGKDYITVLGNGSQLFLSNNSDTDTLAFTNCDHITVIGLDVDGNNINNTGGVGSCIDFNTCVAPLIQGCKITNSFNHAIHIIDSSEYQVLGNHITNTGDDCITALNSNYGVVANNYLEPGHVNISTGGSYGVEIEDGSNFVSITGNTITTKIATSASGIHELGGILVDTSSSQASCNHVTITGNAVSDVENFGIHIRNDRASTDNIDVNIVVSSNFVTNCGGFGSIALQQVQAGSVTGNVVTNNDGSDDGQHGIAITACSDITISGNSVRDIQRSGIKIDETDFYAVSNNVITNCGLEGAFGVFGIELVHAVAHPDTKGIISGNVVSDDQGTPTTIGFRFTGSNGINISNNDFSNLDAASLFSGGSLDVDETTLITRNKGYITENRGTGTILALAGNSGNIDHGLDRTPLSGQIVVSPVDGFAGSLSWYVPDNQIDSTKFRIASGNTSATDAVFSWHIIAAGAE